MKFYNREKELANLKTIREAALESAQMTFMVGRRRIGKTSLLLKSVENTTFLYFFISKKSEFLLCQDFVEEIKVKLDTEVYGTFKSFREIFGLLLTSSKSQSFTLIIDEFQELQFINPSIYSEMQNLWDSHKNESKLNLLLCGSVYSLMKRIFEDNKEPLFGRATNKIYLKSFPIATLKEVLQDYNPKYTNEDLLGFYTLTGGVAKYVELLMNAKAFTFKKMLDYVVNENSFFIEEGKNALINEFGKEYGNYFSILSLISASKTSRQEIESILEIQTGGFLERLENEYGILKKTRPIFAKDTGRVVKYTIEDNFLNFWFRFIYKYKSAIEIGNFEFVRLRIIEDFSTYSGLVLEKYFRQKLIDSGKYSAIGNYWEKGNKNEIDIVAVNEYEKRIDFFEVKRNPNKINLAKLELKAEKLTTNFDGYTFNYMSFSLEDL
jgi:AAA+ ATPase superfamily predicted ATPase